MPKLRKHSVVQKSYQCEFCKVKCRRPQDLRRHLFVHTEASFQCDSCGNKFTRYDTLMRHKRDNCRNSQASWIEREERSPSAPATQSFAQHSTPPPQDATETAASPMNPQVKQPILSAEILQQSPMSPASQHQRGYTNSPPFIAAVQPVVQSPHAQPQIPTALSSYPVAWQGPPHQIPHTPPQLVVNTEASPSLPSLVNVTPGPPLPSHPFAAVEYAPIAGIASPAYVPPPPGFSSSNATPSPSIPAIEGSSTGSGSMSPYNGQLYPTFPVHPPAEQMNQELPRLPRYPIPDNMVKKEGSLQPLEPNPHRFSRNHFH